jgi:hypothetical protein
MKPVCPVVMLILFNQHLNQSILLGNVILVFLTPQNSGEFVKEKI